MVQATVSPSLAQALPFWRYFPWFCLFFCPPSANLHNKGSVGAAKATVETREWIQWSPRGTNTLSYGTNNNHIRFPYQQYNTHIQRTRHSWWSLDEFPVEMLNYGLTLLCGLHSKIKERKRYSPHIMLFTWLARPKRHQSYSFIKMQTNSGQRCRPTWQTPHRGWSHWRLAGCAWKWPGQRT